MSEVEKEKDVETGVPFSSHTFILPFVYQGKRVNWMDWEEVGPDSKELPYIKNISQSAEVVSRVNYGYQRYYNNEAKEIIQGKSRWASQLLSEAYSKNQRKQLAESLLWLKIIIISWPTNPITGFLITKIVMTQMYWSILICRLVIS